MKIINVISSYAPISDTFITGIFVKLKNGKEVCIKLAHDKDGSISSSDLAGAFRELANIIDAENA